LIEALAISDAHFMVDVCLKLLEDTQATNRAHYGRTLWICASNSIDPPALGRLILFCEGGIQQPDPVLNLWCARVILEKYERYSTANVIYPSVMLAALAERCRESSLAASQIVASNIESGEFPALIEDYSYLLQHRYQETLSRIQARSGRFAEIDRLIIAGIASYLTPSRMRVAERGREKVCELVRVLTEYVDRAGPDACALIAPLAISSVAQCHVNEDYYLSKDVVVESGLDMLAAKVVLNGDERAHQELDAATWRFCEDLRDRVFEAIRDSTVHPSHVGNIVFRIFHHETAGRDQLEAIEILRTAQYRSAWDTGVLRYLNCHPREAAKFAAECDAYWAALPQAEQSDKSEEFLKWRAAGANVLEASWAVAVLSDIGKRMFRGELRRKSRRSATP
jgi:hypothetical protein